MLRIRLTRIGKKHLPAYRIVVKEKRSKRDGDCVDSIGHWNPSNNPEILKIDKDRLNYWISKGAQMSEAVKELITKT